MTASTRRFDPDRRERIIDACLEVIAEVGVAGTSHRRVAAAADVPLGSMTYHFAGMEALLHEAFGTFARRGADRFAERMASVTDPEGAAEAMVELIVEAGPDHRDLVLSHELYTLAARDPAFRDLTDTWMAHSRTVLERFFDPVTARVLDALNQGFIIHRALDLSTDPEPYDAATVGLAVRRITGL